MSVTLPILVVETNHSRYEIDQNAGTYTRTRIHDGAADLAYADIIDGEPVEYQEIYVGPTVGEQLVIVHPGGSWVRSTVVQSVTEKVPVE